MAKEIELKLATDSDTLSALTALSLPPGWQAGPWQQQHLRNHYFDTDDQDLQERGLALRLREQGDRIIQTIKDAGSSVGGLHQRNEWDAYVASPALDITKLPDQEWTAWLTGLWRDDRLNVMFSTDFVRQKRELRHDSGSVIEMALDSGKVHADGESERISEVELELKSGPIDALFLLAQHLAEHHPLYPDGRSKAERGYRLLDIHEQPNRRLQPLSLREDATAWDVFVAAVQGAWSHWQLYENEFRSQQDVNSAEQLRRAAALLRHALTCFHGLPLPVPIKQWQRQLTHILRIFSWVESARELLAADALVHRLEGENYLPCQEALAELLPDERDFGDGVARALLYLHSRDYCRFALGIAQFLQHPPTPDAPLLHPVKDAATALVVRQWEALQNYWQHAAGTVDQATYRAQRHHLEHAVSSGLLFGQLFDEHQQNQLIHPCRDLLAGIQDANSLEQLDTIARELNADDYRDFTLWLMAQRETLADAMRMTREWALKAEPEDLED